MFAYINELSEIRIKDKIFNSIKHESVLEKEIFSLPINKESKNKKIQKVSIKLTKSLLEENIRKVVLSNELFENEILKNVLEQNRINVLDGKLIYKILLPQIIQKICLYKNSDIKEEKITILVDENNEINKNNILKISQEAKVINIVTNFINKFITTANYLYEELGILVRISNNIKKDLLNSNIIINIDFNEDLINKYYINPKAIIVNVPDNVKITSKKFSGININSYNIIIPEDYELIGFDDKHIYEARIYYKNLHEIEQSIEENQIEIESLIGKNGIINKKEFLDF